MTKLFTEFIIYKIIFGTDSLMGDFHDVHTMEVGFY